MAFIICIAALIIMMFVFTKMLLSFGNNSSAAVESVDATVVEKKQGIYIHMQSEAHVPYHENPNLIKADGYYLYNFGSPRHYYWALPVKFTHEGKVYHSQLPLDIRDESSSCTVDLRIYIPADSSGSAFAFRNNITIPALWRIFIFVPLLLLLTSKRKA